MNNNYTIIHSILTLVVAGLISARMLSIKVQKNCLQTVGKSDSKLQMFTITPKHAEASTDSSSSDDEDNENNKENKRVTKSVTVGQEKVLVALLKKFGPNVSPGWRGRVAGGMGGVGRAQLT